MKMFVEPMSQMNEGVSWVPLTLRQVRFCMRILAARLSFTIRCRSDGDDDSELS